MFQRNKLISENWDHTSLLPIVYEIGKLVSLQKIDLNKRYLLIHSVSIRLQSYHQLCLRNPETTPGGRALKFYSTIRLEVRRAEQIKQSGDVIGNRVKIKVVKNKVAPPFKVAEVDIMYGKGISQSGELLDMAADKDIIDKAGSWYSYKSDRIGQGRENAKKYLEDHPDIYQDIQQQVRQAYGIDEKSVADREDPEKIKEKREEAQAEKSAEAKKTTDDK